MNLPLTDSTVRALKKRRRLGLGVHLNITLGEPLSRRSNVLSLVKPEGCFRRPPDYLEKMPSVKEVAREYVAQIRLFEKRFSRPPDHLDTHHHLHDHPVFFSALSEVARRWKIPIRRSRIFQMADYAPRTKNLQTTDYLFGNLEARFIWQIDSFLGIVENLSEGTSEIGCHPGFCDTQLREISSLQDVREKELQLFSDPSLRKVLSSLGIEPIHFSEV